MRKMICFLLVAVLLCLPACGEEEEKTTTLSGMVVSVEGSVITFVETISGTGSRPNMAAGEGSFDGNFDPENFTMPEGFGGGMPGGFGGEMPEGFDPENFTMPEGFDPGSFGGGQYDGTMPEGFEGGMPGGFGGGMPGGFGGEMPEGFDPENFTMPEGFDPESFGGGQYDGTMPEGFEGGKRPQRGEGSGMENMETKELDIGNAHISVEIEDGKEAGSLESVKAGTMVTLTLDADGKVTNVLVTSSSGFGGGRRQNR